MKPNKRDDYHWDKLARQFKAHCRMRNMLCHLCVLRGDIEHAVIDYTAKPRTPNAFEADHIKTVHAAPEMRFVWNNLAASHSRCNRQRRDMTLEEYAAMFGVEIDANGIARQPDWVVPDW